METTKREIKFRAWDEDFKEYMGWGDLIDTPLFWDGIDGKDCVLEQFTGLHDKNGKEIFEGDICEWIGREVHAGKQVYPKRIFAVENDIVNLHKLYCLISNETGLKIIGNIHQNPELLT